MKQKDHNRYIDREKSWLAFNERVLQEAADETVPLLDRFRFLGIFSNNLDEFFRVRYASVRRISMSKNALKKLDNGQTASELLQEITEIVINLQSESLQILHKIEEELNRQNIFMIDETEVDEIHHSFIKDFFINEVSPDLVTIILNDLAEFPLLRDAHGYLAVKMVMKQNVPYSVKVEMSKSRIRDFIKECEKRNWNIVCS